MGRGICPRGPPRGKPCLPACARRGEAVIPVGIDCEWQKGRPGRQAPPLACVAIAANGDQTLWHHTEFLDVLVPLLRDTNVLLVGHYVASDFVVLINQAPELTPLVFDAYEADRITCTQIRQKLCDIAGGVYRGFEDVDGDTVKLNYSLADLAQRHLGFRLEKEDTWRLRYGELIPLPLRAWPKEAIEYALKDAQTPLDIWRKQEENSFFLEDQFRQARASFWLRLMTTWGIRTDERGINELAARTQRDYDRIAADLTSAGLLWGPKVRGRKSGTPGSRNTKAAQERVIAAYARLGKPVPLTDGGKSGNKAPCTDRVTCEESGDKTLISYARLSSLKNTLTKDIPQLRPGVSTPIHVYVEDMLETGRTSMKPNFQNLKRQGGIRECVVPTCLRCGRVSTEADIRADRCLGCGAVLTVMWSCDYGGLELYTQAQMCMTILKHSRLAIALNEGMDPHLMIAEKVLNRPYAELKAIKKAGVKPDCRAKYGHCQCAYCVMSDARQVGKVANFGFPGGLGAAALVFFALNNYGVHLSEDEAKRLKRYWLDTWPEFSEYFNWVNSKTDRAFPQIEQLFCGRYRGGVRFTEACNTIFQGLGADIAKSAGWLIYRAMYDHTVGSVLYGSRGNNFVHDEFVGMSPLPIAHECALEVRRLMLDAARPWLPDVTTIDVEPALMWRYSKEAGPKYESGRLVPWVA